MNGPPTGDEKTHQDDAADPGSAEDGERALRRRELLTRRVREANRLSRSGPDSPSLGRPG